MCLGLVCYTSWVKRWSKAMDFLQNFPRQICYFAAKNCAKFNLVHVASKGMLLCSLLQQLCKIQANICCVKRYATLLQKIGQNSSSYMLRQKVCYFATKNWAKFKPVHVASKGMLLCYKKLGKIHARTCCVKRYAILLQILWQM